MSHSAVFCIDSGVITDIILNFATNYLALGDMNFFRFIATKCFWYNVLIAIVIAAMFIVAVLWGLTYYTSAGRTIIVPDVKGYTVAQISSQLKNCGLDYVVIDSLYKQDVQRGAIVEQIPNAGKSVKKGRKIFLTINAYTSEKVLMPQLVDYSLRNAKVVLETIGLKIGEITYKPSAYNDLVLGQMVDGKLIKAGEKIEKGTKVQLIVGSGDGGNVVVVPELTGLTLAEAQMTLQASSLRVGTLIYDNSVKTPEDTTTAVVYRQLPVCINGQVADMGSSVQMWLTKNNDVVIDAMEAIENAKKE